MTPTLTSCQTAAAAAATACTSGVKAGRSSLLVERLTNADRDEVLEFLSARPLHTVIMAGWILENGVESERNRGHFYGCRNSYGALQGVALIGHVVLFEARTVQALELLAQSARDCGRVRTIIGEEGKTRRFWGEFWTGGTGPRMVSHDLLYELQREPVGDCSAVEDLRVATTGDLEKIVPAHARLVFEETGVNPLGKDFRGFYERCARRVEQGRVWVWTEGGRLIFKADVVADTPDVAYLEGVFINPEARGLGYGRRCFSHLTKVLSVTGRTVCGFVDVENGKAQGFYERAGYSAASRYMKILL